MALHLYLGNSGSGKTYGMYKELIRQSEESPRRRFLLLVPEQFTLQTQKDLVLLHPDHVLVNLEVLSFDRLSYRVFQELGVKQPDVLEEVGKNLILRRVAEEKKDELTVLSKYVKKPGYISELKSLFSEFQQYDISPEDVTDMGNAPGFPDGFRQRMEDIRRMYEGFQSFLSDRYITREEILDRLADVIGESRVVRNAVIAFDGFTGFTPVQKKVLERMFPIAGEVYATVTTLPEGDYLQEGSGDRLFSMSARMIRTLLDVAEESGQAAASPVLFSTDGKGDRKSVV